MRQSLICFSLCLFTFMFLPVVVLAQPSQERAPPLDPSLWPKVKEALAQGAAAGLRSIYLGTGQALSIAGREDLVFTPEAGARKVCKPLLRDGKPVEPIAYISEAARGARVTMINEAHAEPQTRKFITQVAVALRPVGYGTYAAETFNPGIQGGVTASALLSDGYYSKEPIYGRLMRILRNQNYRLVPYEADLGALTAKVSPAELATARMVEQAANLASKVKYDTSKVLVHAGQGNLSEYSGPARPKVMGAKFADISGINPLTIETTSQEAPGDIPVVCDPTAIAGLPNRYDIFIGLPKLTFERNRPRWRLEAGDRFVDVPRTLRRPDQIVIYEARPVGEAVNTTPIDRVLLRPNESVPLLLPPGSYTISAWSEKEGWLATSAPIVVVRD